MCLTSCNTFQKHLLSQKENLIFWPQKWIFEISEAIFDSFWHPNMRKRHCKATLKVSKNFLRPSIKNRLDTFVPNVLGINLIPFSWSYDQNWLRETLKTEKKAKTPAKWAFWNNRLQMLTNFWLSAWCSQQMPFLAFLELFLLTAWARPQISQHLLTKILESLTHILK